MVHNNEETFENLKEVKISMKQYNELLNDQRLLVALQSVGVDSWEGYDVVLDLYKENRY